MMKKTLFAALATATAVTAMAGAASAQPYGGYEGRYERGYDDYDRGGRYERGNINQRQAEIERRIEIGHRRGALTRNEATSLGNEARDIARLESRYRRDGLAPWERADLGRRLDRLESRLWQQARDDDRNYRYGQGYGYRR